MDSTTIDLFSFLGFLYEFLTKREFCGALGSWGLQGIKFRFFAWLNKLLEIRLLWFDRREKWLHRNNSPPWVEPLVLDHVSFLEYLDSGLSNLILLILKKVILLLWLHNFVRFLHNSERVEIPRIWLWGKQSALCCNLECWLLLRDLEIKERV